MLPLYPARTHPLLHIEGYKDMTVVSMSAGDLHPYHKHEQLVQTLAGVDIASGEEIGVTPDNASILMMCFSLHKEAICHQSRVVSRGRVCNLKPANPASLLIC